MDIKALDSSLMRRTKNRFLCIFDDVTKKKENVHAVYARMYERGLL